MNTEKDQSNWVAGRGWIVYTDGAYTLNAFDAFGNRDHYDYFGYHKKECIYRGKKQPEDVAIKLFKEEVNEHRKESKSN